MPETVRLSCVMRREHETEHASICLFARKYKLWMSMSGFDAISLVPSTLRRHVLPRKLQTSHSADQLFRLMSDDLKHVCTRARIHRPPQSIHRQRLLFVLDLIDEDALIWVKRQSGVTRAVSIYCSYLGAANRLICLCLRPERID